jgi:hypothetical protein
MKRFFVCLGFLLIAVQIEASDMARVIDVIDSRTIVIERGGARTAVRLANVDVPADAEEHAASVLRDAIAGRWALVENAPGGVNVYRSPDALFVNAVVVRSWIEPRPQHSFQFLGSVSPGTQHATVHVAPAPQVRAPSAWCSCCSLSPRADRQCSRGGANNENRTEVLTRSIEIGTPGPTSTRCSGMRGDVVQAMKRNETSARTARRMLTPRRRFATGARP